MGVGTSINLLFEIQQDQSLLLFAIDFVQDGSSSGGSFCIIGYHSSWVLG
jgi:hypothetical protein